MKTIMIKKIFLLFLIICSSYINCKLYAQTSNSSLITNIEGGFSTPNGVGYIKSYNPAPGSGDNYWVFKMKWDYAGTISKPSFILEVIRSTPDPEPLVLATINIPYTALSFENGKYVFELANAQTFFPTSPSYNYICRLRVANVITNGTTFTANRLSNPNIGASMYVLPENLESYAVFANTNTTTTFVANLKTFFRSTPNITLFTNTEYSAANYNNSLSASSSTIGDASTFQNLPNLNTISLRPKGVTTNSATLAITPVLSNNVLKFSITKPSGFSFPADNVRWSFFAVAKNGNTVEGIYLIHFYKGVLTISDNNSNKMDLSIDNNTDAPKDKYLGCFPSAFDTQTQIHFEQSTSGAACLEVYDI